jgi:hypothetical protein
MPDQTDEKIELPEVDLEAASRLLGQARPRLRSRT